MSSLLEVRGLTVKYGRITAVHGIDLRVEEGEVVGLVGPNGAGKSSSLSSIFGLVRPSDGTITYEGQSLVGKSPEAIIRMGIALVPEGRHIFSSLTVAENLRLGATPRTDRSRIDDEVKGLVERFPSLGRYYDDPAGRLSGGEQQQLAIARALLSDPKLLLLDEPTLGLAPLVIDLVFEILAQLREEGVTVLLVEQNATRTIEFADRSYLLKTGQIVASGAAAELSGQVDLAHAYLGV